MTDAELYGIERAYYKATGNHMPPHVERLLEEVRRLRALEEAVFACGVSELVRAQQEILAARRRESV